MQGSGAKARSLQGQVALPEATDPVSYAYRERLRRRLGDGGAAAAYRLEHKITLEETGLAITRASDVTRYRLSGTAEWRLIDVRSGKPVHSEIVSSLTGYDATASAYASRAAETAAQERLATELAELTASRILALINQSQGS